MTAGRVEGIELKLERVRARLFLGDIAEAMGVSTTRIAQLESAALVTPKSEARYREAMAKALRERSA